MSYDYVQYIVVRKDLVETMGIGKTAAQVAHASLGVLLSSYDNLQLRNDESIKQWLNGAFTKLVVYVKSKQKLINLADKLQKDAIPYKLIWDACRTVLIPEEEDGTTLTCMGIAPFHRDLVPKYLKELRLL